MTVHMRPEFTKLITPRHGAPFGLALLLVGALFALGGMQPAPAHAQTATTVFFDAKKSDGSRYNTGTYSKLPVTVSTGCASDKYRKVTSFDVVTSSGFSARNAGGGLITVPTFTTDSANHWVEGRCKYQNGSQATLRFQVQIAQADVTPGVFVPSTMSLGGQAVITASGVNRGTKPSGVFALSVTVPAGLTVTGVTPYSTTGCTTTAAGAGSTRVSCNVSALAPGASQYFRVDTRSDGSVAGPVRIASEITPQYVDFPGNDTTTATIDIIGKIPDLTVTINAFSGIQPNMDNEIEIRVHNLSEVVASAATVRVTLPAGLTYVGTLEPDACSATGQVLDCTLMPWIAAGWSDHIEVLVRPTVPSGASMTITAEADALKRIVELDETNNSATMTATVGGGAAHS